MKSSEQSRKDYEAAIAYFREHPGDSAGCARLLGVHYRTARAWWIGPQSVRYEWMRPIREVFAEEKAAEARAEQREEDERTLALFKEAERAREAAKEAQKFEDNAIALARADVLHGMGALAKMTRGIVAMCDRVNAMLERGEDENGNPLKINVHDAMRVIRQFTTSTRGMVESADALVRLGRVQRDLPDTIIGLDIQAISVEDVERHVRQANKALERARKLGLARPEPAQLPEVVDMPEGEQ